jgi:hypothetical protein
MSKSGHVRHTYVEHDAVDDFSQVRLAALVSFFAGANRLAINIPTVLSGLLQIAWYFHSLGPWDRRLLRQDERSNLLCSCRKATAMEYDWE